MKTIKEIQEYNRKKIICAVHNTDDYEEALEKELDFGCKIITSSIEQEELTVYERLSDYVDLTVCENDYDYESSEIATIIGKPLTLNRVLLALNERSDFRCSISGVEIEIFGYIWDLKKETLEEQIEYLQRGFYKLLGGGE